MSFTENKNEAKKGISVCLSKLKKRLQEQNIADQKIDIQIVATSFAIAFPLIAFVYWTLFIEEFNEDYFQFCYSLEDILYTLYYRGTYLMYIGLLLSFLYWGFIPLVRKKMIWYIITIIISALAMGLVAKISHFNTLQIVLFMILVTGISTTVIFFNKNFLYAYILLFGFYFVAAAEVDAKHALRHPKSVTIVAKTGETILDENESDRIYIGSTSKYILIYHTSIKKLEKYNRDDVR